MGGPTSGRWDIGYVRRKTVESCRSLSIIEWTRSGALRPRVNTQGIVGSGNGREQKLDFEVRFRVIWKSAERPFCRLTYEVPSTAETVQYWIRFACTHPKWGGVRFWFICPLIGLSVPCRRRVGKLYLPPNCKYFGCRHCYQLSYSSVQEYERRAGRARVSRSLNAFGQLLASFEDG
jgi:hypothetical protein